MEIVIVVAVAAAVAAVGIRVGMLLAPRLDRWTAPRDPDTEDPKD